MSKKINKPVVEKETALVAPTEKTVTETEKTVAPTEKTVVEIAEEKSAQTALKDAEILAANPNASTQELLELGISQDKYFELLDKKKIEDTPEPLPVVTVVAKAKVQNFPTNQLLTPAYQERLKRLKSK